jgi:1-deoxy-D-xylulose-5-phosphate reductoisomerase
MRPKGSCNGDFVTRSASTALDARPPSSARQPKRLVILGATGSIGRSCADVILASPGRFEVVALAAGRDGAALARAAIELNARFAAVADPAGYGALKEGLAGRDIEVGAGPAAVREAALRDCDLVVAAIAGTVGLAPTFAAIGASRTVALANKEPLVCAGAAVISAARASGARLLPLDSEHNAIFQALGGRDASDVVRMTITASGGPFRDWSLERINAATKAEALAHPNWSMGPKITIDSASLMNKGLELIEAHHLFGVPPERLDVVVHPQSIVHGLVSFADGSVIAGMAKPDMKTPIAHCLAYPERIASGAVALDLAAIGQLTFSRPDFTRFPALRLAVEALRDGGGAPTTLNGANEIAVHAFLEGRIGFSAIAALVEDVLEQAARAGEIAAPSSVEEALAIHHIARDRAEALLA